MLFGFHPKTLKSLSISSPPLSTLPLYAPGPHPTRPPWGALGTVVRRVTDSFMSASTASTSGPRYRYHRPPAGPHRRGEPFPVSFHFTCPAPAPPPTGRMWCIINLIRRSLGLELARVFWCYRGLELVHVILLELVRVFWCNRGLELVLVILLELARVFWSV
jgi:hypothetical protein